MRHQSPTGSSLANTETMTSYRALVVLCGALAVAVGLEYGYGGLEGHHEPISHEPIHEEYHSVPVPHQFNHDDYHHEEHHEEYHEPASYSFEYKVNDPHTGDIKSQHEVRDGDNVKGYYMLKEADGTTREVHYSADKHEGFKAIVSKSGHPEPQHVPEHHEVPVHHEEPLYEEHEQEGHYF